MEKYISKSALVARIKKIKMDVGNIFNEYDEGFWEGRATAFDDVICELDTLEVIEVDLEEETDKEWNKCEPIDEGMGLEIASIEHEQFDNIAKHFFELGMQVSNKAQKGE